MTRTRASAKAAGSRFESQVAAYVFGSDIFGRVVRCALCDKPVRSDQRVVVRDDQPLHAQCVALAVTSQKQVDR